MNWEIEAMNLAKAMGEFYRQHQLEESITGEMPAYAPPPNNTIIGLFPNDPTMLLAIAPYDILRMFLRWGSEVRVNSPHWRAFKSHRRITFEELYYALKRMLEYQTPFIHFLDPEAPPNVQVKEFKKVWLIQVLLSLSDSELNNLIKDEFGNDIPGGSIWSLWTNTNE